MAVTSIGIGSFFILHRLFYQIILLEHCVKAAQEILVLLAQVRILVFQQKLRGSESGLSHQSHKLKSLVRIQPSQQTC